ncbi:MAG: hypothetical protein KKA42_13570, partial [candidate division Zixibacteria bacterium]|nr:hypothetical protein [candidate division Zixibacteria bacterium]
LTNRMEKRDDGLSVKEAVAQKGVAFHNMSGAVDMLPRVYRKLNPGETIAREIESEFKLYGLEPVKLG